MNSASVNVSTTCGKIPTSCVHVSWLFTQLWKEELSRQTKIVTAWHLPFRWNCISAWLVSIEAELSARLMASVTKATTRLLRSRCSDFGVFWALQSCSTAQKKSFPQGTSVHFSEAAGSLYSSWKGILTRLLPIWFLQVPGFGRVDGSWESKGDTIIGP